MGNFNNVGLNNVGSYQVSGVPWITGSNNLAAGIQHQIHFPRVAKRVTVIAQDVASQEIRVHFNSTGSADASGSIDVVNGRHYVALASDGASIELAVKCREVYISTNSTAGDGARTYTVIAELTQIPYSRMYDLTGSGLTELVQGQG